MPLALDQDLAARLKDPGSFKVLATINDDGQPHVVFKGSLQVDDQGGLRVLEVTPDSQTGRNLEKARQRQATVAINVRSPDGRSTHIVGRPREAITTGPVYDQHLQALRSRRADLNLAAVWYIDALEVSEKAPASKPAQTASK